jgi:hypothetical protein
MRKAAILVALLAPVAALAQAMSPISDPFTALSGSLTSVLVPLFVVAVVGIGIKTVCSGDFDGLLKVVLPMGVLVACASLAFSLLGGVAPETPPSAPISPETWTLLLHGALWVLGGIACAGSAWWVWARKVNRQKEAKQARLDVRFVLETVERAEQLELYWEHVGVPEAEAGRGLRPSSAAERVDTIAKVKREALTFLAAVHEGHALAEAQRKRLDFLRGELNRCMKGADGQPLDVGAALSRVAPELPPEASRRLEATVPASGERRPRPSLPAQVVAVPETVQPDPLDFVNPLSPWNLWRDERARREQAESDAAAARAEVARSLRREDTQSFAWPGGSGADQQAAADVGSTCSAVAAAGSDNDGWSSSIDLAPGGDGGALGLVCSVGVDLCDVSVGGGD